MTADTRTMWAVGPEGKEGWQAIAAKTEKLAIKAYCDMHDCEPKYIIAMRVPAWDGLEKVRPVDWFNSDCGLTWACEACECQTSAELDGRIIDAAIYCEDCAAEMEKPHDRA